MAAALEQQCMMQTDIAFLCMVSCFVEEAPSYTELYNQLALQIKTTTFSDGYLKIERAVLLKSCHLSTDSIAPYCVAHNLNIYCSKNVRPNRVFN